MPNRTTKGHFVRRYFGKWYDKTTIGKVFSKEKKRVLTYWVGDSTK